MRTKTTILAVLCALLACGTAPSSGSYTISNPTDSALYTTTSNIDSYGDTGMGEDVLVKIVTPNTATAAEKRIDVGENFDNWQWNFTAPSGGWSPQGDGWTIILFHVDDLMNSLDTNGFTIQDGA